VDSPKVRLEEVDHKQMIRVENVENIGELLLKQPLQSQLVTLIPTFIKSTHYLLGAGASGGSET
jgi:hypothetical protein